MKRYRLLFCLPILYLLLTGCSIIGIAIGANTETEEVYYKNIESDSPEFKSLELAEGDSITVFTKNGDSLNGFFIASKNLSIKEYTNGFINTFKDNIYFPKPNDTLWTIMDEKVVNYEFLGFDSQSIIMRDVRNDTLVISLDEPFILLEEQNKILKEKDFIELIQIKTDIVKSVSFYRYMQLMELYAGHNNKKILIKHMEDIVIIPFSDISQIVVPYRKDYALTGFLVGLGIDVLIITIWLSSDPIPSNFEMDMK